MKNLLVLFFFLVYSINVIAEVNPNSFNSEKPVFEITDKFDQVTLGFTESTVYMVFSERIRQISNTTYNIQYQMDTDIFEDSKGNFITGNISVLESNRIEVLRSDISGLTIKKGEPLFTYLNSPSIKFEDIYSYNGTKAIENFYLNDLERLVNAFSK